MLECKNLKFSYSENKTFSFPSFECKSSETLLILGNSGSGKTTLLHLLALLLKPSSGQIMIDNQDFSRISSKDAALARANNIGIIYQKPHFVSSLNVIDNLLVANYFANNKLSSERANHLAESLDMQGLLNKKTTELSGGEQQRLSIARALMNSPIVVLADEPTSNLDDSNCNKVIDLLEKQTTGSGAALVIVTHDQRLKNKFSNQIILT